MIVYPSKCLLKLLQKAIKAMKFAALGIKNVSNCKNERPPF